jgi:hypothetical protein
MHFDWLSIVGLIATAVGGWIGHRFTAPKHQDRAALLERIAVAAAALVVSLNPNANWATLLEMVVNQIASAAGTPTTNRDAIQRAAASALTHLGKNPGAQP